MSHNQHGTDFVFKVGCAYETHGHLFSQIWKVSLVWTGKITEGETYNY